MTKKFQSRATEVALIFMQAGRIIIQSMHRGRMLWKFYELVMKMLSDLHIFLQTHFFNPHFPSDSKT